LLQAIQVLGFQLCLRKHLPELRIVRSDRQNPAAQFDNRRFILRGLSCPKLRSQLRDLLILCSSLDEVTKTQ